MSDFIRPEVAKNLKRHRETLSGAALVLVGLYLAWQPGWVMTGIGAALTIAGLAVGVVSLRRLTFKAANDGPGVVEVTERQITYFTSQSGGAVSINALARVTALRDAAQSAPEGLHWLLEEDGGPRLIIPANAAGADALFDAFSALPGFDFGAVNSKNATHTAWSRGRAHLH